MTDNPLANAFTINEFAEWAKIGRTKIYSEINKGALRAIKVGSRTIIPAAAACEWIGSQPGYPTVMVRRL